MTQFGEQITRLIGKQVRLGRGGPDEQRGTLESVCKDYLTIRGVQGRVHYPLHHLKSVTEILGGEAEYDATSGSDPSEEWSETLPETFAELMHSCVGKRIQVYDHGPESAYGFAFECGPDFVKIVTGPDEMVHYPFFHIRSMRLVKGKKSSKGGSGSGSGGSKSGSGKSSGKSGGKSSGKGRGKSRSGQSCSGQSRSGKGRSGKGRSGKGRSDKSRSGKGRGKSSGKGRGKSSGKGRSGHSRSSKSRSGKCRS